jgi:uncharacterized protein (TIGR03435 family)
VVAGGAFAQETVSVPPAAMAQPDAVKVPQFDVISVKANKGAAPGMELRITKDGFSAINVNLDMLLLEGYQVDPDQLVGQPSWSKSAGFDIDAKVAGEDVAALNKISFDQRRQMFQQILKERFGLKIHHETKDLPVYVLEVAKGGPKLQESKQVDKPTGQPKGGPGRFMVNRGKMTAQGSSMTFLSTMLSRQLGRTVVDKTGLTGSYDYTLTYTPEDMSAGGGHDAGTSSAPADTGPSIFTALQEQLGLKLESQKAPVDVIVIDQVDKPAEN